MITLWLHLILQHWRITCRTKIGKENHYLWLIFWSAYLSCRIALSLTRRSLTCLLYFPSWFFFFFPFWDLKFGSEFVALPSTPFLTKYIGRPLAERINKTKITHSSFRFPCNSDSAQIWFPFEQKKNLLIRFNIDLQKFEWQVWSLVLL